MGADDYLAKPFNPHELTARVAAILRRSRAPPVWARDPARRRPRPPSTSRRCRSTPVAWSSTWPAAASRSPSTRARRPVDGRLTPGEIGLLAALARRPGAVLSRDQLLEVVTRRPDEVYDRVIDVHVANLRRKLGDDAAKPVADRDHPADRLSPRGDPGRRVSAPGPGGPAPAAPSARRHRSLAWRLGLRARDRRRRRPAAGRGRGQSGRQQQLPGRPDRPAAAAARRRRRHHGRPPVAPGRAGSRPGTGDAACQHARWRSPGHLDRRDDAGGLRPSARR